MKDTELYRHLLGIESPWMVSRVELDVTGHQVDVWSGHKEGVRFACPECGEKLGVYDHAAERQWRHLDSCQFRTLLHAKIPRVKCPEHGVVQAKVPWAEARSRFTLMFERFAIDVLKQTDVSGAATILGLSWDEVHLIMKKAVERGRARKAKTVPRRVGIDEKAITKGHTYVSTVSDLVKGTVEYIADGRTEKSLFEYFAPFTVEDVAGIEAVAMDMWKPFFNTVMRCVPGAKDKIVFDRFHIVAHMHKAVDQVRRAECKRLRAEGDTTLVKTRYLWLTAPERLDEDRAADFKALQSMKLKTARAWGIKEMLRELWACSTRKEAMVFYKRWHHWATHCRLRPGVCQNFCVT
jgi:transposase